MQERASIGVIPLLIGMLLFKSVSGRVGTRRCFVHSSMDSLDLVLPYWHIRLFLKPLVALPQLHELPSRRDKRCFPSDDYVCLVGIVALIPLCVIS